MFNTAKTFMLRHESGCSNARQVNMHRSLFYGRTLCAALLTALLLTAAAQAHPLKSGDSFPDIPLTGTLTPQQQQELGLKSGQAPVLSGIGTPFVLMEIFSMYCPFCQAEAENMNRLHTAIRQEGLDGTIAVIGLGAGNSQFEVDFFRTKYSVPFALFTDPELELHKQTGETATPHFYLISLKDRKPRVIYSHTGRMQSVDDMLQTLRSLTGRE
jgi:peroxiredoxin